MLETKMTKEALERTMSVIVSLTGEELNRLQFQSDKTRYLVVSKFLLEQHLRLDTFAMHTPAVINVLVDEILTTADLRAFCLTMADRIGLYLECSPCIGVKETLEYFGNTMGNAMPAWATTTLLNEEVSESLQHVTADWAPATLFQNNPWLGFTVMAIRFLHNTDHYAKWYTQHQADVMAAANRTPAPAAVA